jgi:hypothetical protein
MLADIWAIVWTIVLAGITYYFVKAAKAEKNDCEALALQIGTIVGSILAVAATVTTLVITL